MSNEYYIYIMANKRNGTLYIGSTSDLPRRVWEHKSLINESFTKRYQCTNLVYYEFNGDYDGARTREMQLKKWNRAWKLELIESMNPGWQDLYDELF